jgi:aryl-alcohol dehydrogenase-like predicted oxidoreductase
VKTRPLGKTGLVVSELSLGTFGLSGDGYGPVAESEVDRTIDRAVSAGINLFDTADVYGKGEMEKKLGERLPAASTLIVTKLGTDTREIPHRKVFSPDYLREAFERSRDRIKRDVLDVVLLHNPSMKTMDSGEAVGFLKALKTMGQIRAWGVSAGSKEVARAAVDRDADVVELVYNIFVARDLHEMAGDVAQHETGILARSVLAYGLLTGHWTADREFNPGDHRAQRWTKAELQHRIQQLDALRPAVTGTVTSLRACALRFVLANQIVSSAVLGPRSVAQLDNLVRDVAVAPPYLSPAALAGLSRRLLEAGIAL